MSLWSRKVAFDSAQPTRDPSPPDSDAPASSSPPSTALPIVGVPNAGISRQVLTLHLVSRLAHLQPFYDDAVQPPNLVDAVVEDCNGMRGLDLRLWYT